MEKLFHPRNLLSSLYVRQAGSYLVVTHISLALTFYQETILPHAPTLE
jgi:hypothetical protein